MKPLNSRDIEKILLSWNLEKKLEIVPIQKTNVIKAVTNTWFIGSKYVLKMGDNIDGLKTHIIISKALVKQGLKGSTPVMTKDNEEFIIENNIYFVLMNKIDGVVLEQSEKFSENRFDVGVMYGEAISKLHHSLLEINDKVDVPEKHLNKSITEWALPETKKIFESYENKLPKEFYEFYLSKPDELFDSLPKQVIHRDVHCGNIIFEKGVISGFIDFEISERNIRLYDPCYFATSVLSESSNVDNGFNLWPEILYGVIKGYNGMSKLSKQELKAIPYVIYSNQMIFIAWLGDKVEHEELAKKNREMLLWLWKNHDKIFGGLELSKLALISKGV